VGVTAYAPAGPVYLNMKKALLNCAVWCGVAVLSLALCGCGKKSASSLASKNDAAFSSATPEVKGAWEASKAAMKTNGYAVAIAALTGAKAAAGLSPDQSRAIDETVTAISDQMYEAANREDPAAKQAIEDLRTMMGR
jgi:hypothetical protein